MEFVEKLIELVRTNKILYDMSDVDYKNCKKKDKVWDDIGKELGCGGDFAKGKWKNLRDTYNRNLRNAKTKTGQSFSNNKKWQWADHMETFRPFLSFANTTTNISEISVTDNSAQSETSICENNNEIPCTSDIATETQPQCHHTQFPLPSSSIISRKRKITTTEEKHSQSVEAIINYMEKKAERKREPNPTELMFSAYAKIVNSFSARRQVVVRNTIGQLIMQHELEHLAEENNDLSATSDIN